MTRFEDQVSDVIEGMLRSARAQDLTLGEMRERARHGARSHFGYPPVAAACEIWFVTLSGVPERGDRT